MKLSRRTVLRGTGVALALPLLDAMLDSKGRLLGAAQAAGEAFPLRVMAYHFPHGVVQDRWRPAAVGDTWELTEGLMPFSELKGDITVVSNLDQTAGFAGIGGQHAQGMPAFASGSPGIGSGSSGPSFDQVLAEEMGAATPFRSLVANNEQAGTSAEQATTAHMNNIAWGSNGRPVEAQRDLMKFYATLVSAGPASAPGGAAAPSGPSPEAVALLARKKSVLDHVIGEINALNTRVGSVDRTRLQAHLEAVRELERQIQALPPTAGGACAGVESPTGDADADAALRATAYGKAYAMAFACDMTRYASFAMSNGYCDRNYPQFTMNPKGYHLRTHEDIDDAYSATMVVYFAKIFASFLSELKKVHEGDGTLLDNCLIYYGSENSSGYHTFDRMPVVLAGKAGGKLTPGRHLTYPKGTSLARLFLSLLQLAGSKTTQFGKGGDSPLPELLT